MEWSTIVNLIDAQLLIVVAACWALGYMIKQTPRVPDWSIVYLVTAFAIVLVVMLTGFSAQAVLQGILCGAASVYGNQLVKQTAIGKQEVADKKQATKVEFKPATDPVKVEEPAKPVVEQPKPVEQPQVTPAAEVEQPKQVDETVEVKPAPTQPVEQPQPVVPALTVLTQADVSKPASTTAEFSVSEDGTVSVVGEIPPFSSNATAVLFPAGKKEMTFKADERLHWLTVGADAAGDKMAVIGIGEINNNIANIVASTKALAFKVGYTKSDLDESHQYTVGGTYKVVINEQNIEVYYQKGDTFALWYRIAKTADVLSTGETMDWLTPRFGAIVGISEADHTNKNILVEAKFNDTGGSL